MFTHCVFFWLAAGVDDAGKVRFADDLRALLDLPGVRSGTVGAPAATDHRLVDRSYTCGFTVVCADAAAYRAYETHPQRLAFLERWTPQIARAVIYDFEG